MVDSDSKRITQAELARRLGVSRVAVNKAVKSGRITAGEDGLFDPDQAMAEWKSNTRTAMKVAVSPDEKEKRDKGGQAKYASARARKELAHARMAELKEERLRGKYCLLSELEEGVDEVIAVYRTNMESLPSRLAGELVNKDADRIFAILKDETNLILQRAHDDFGRMLKDLSIPDESEFPSDRL